MDETYFLNNNISNVTEKAHTFKRSSSFKSNKICLLNNSNSSSFRSTRSYSSHRSVKRCNCSQTNSRTNLASLVNNLNLNDRTVSWSIVSEEEHNENLQILSALMREKHTSKSNVYLKEQDYDNIDMLVSINSSKNQINDQHTHNLWVKQSRFYVRVSQLGFRGALCLENSKPVSTNLIQRQLMKLFEIW